MKKTRRGPRFNRPDQSTLIAWLGGAVLGVHPACEVAQRISDGDFDSLVASIKEIGLMRPKEINKEKLLVDGRYQFMACYIAGVPITKKTL